MPSPEGVLDAFFCEGPPFPFSMVKRTTIELFYVISRNRTLSREYQLKQIIFTFLGIR